MSTYAIGDIQGCLNELQRLLKHIAFDPQLDTLWFVGDLVNRGPDSHGVVRFVKDLGERAITVLGNHDLHTLAVAHGHLKYSKNDNIHDILDAEDAEELLQWLRHRPLLHHDAGLGFTMIHAGLPPQWDLADAQAHAREVEAALRGSGYVDFLEHMYGNEPDQWREDLQGWQRLRFITNCFSRLRYCDAQGKLYLEEKFGPGSQPAGLLPWFDIADRRSRDTTILFGHWSTLGYTDRNGIYALDTGCLWGGQLTALRLEDRQVFSVDCPQVNTPKDFL